MSVTCHICNTTLANRGDYNRHRFAVHNKNGVRVPNEPQVPSQPFRFRIFTISRNSKSFRMFTADDRICVIDDLEAKIYNDMEAAIQGEGLDERID